MNISNFCIYSSKHFIPCLPSCWLVIDLLVQAAKVSIIKVIVGCKEKEKSRAVVVHERVAFICVTSSTRLVRAVITLA